MLMFIYLLIDLLIYIYIYIYSYIHVYIYIYIERERDRERERCRCVYVCIYIYIYVYAVCIISFDVVLYCKIVLWLIKLMYGIISYHMILLYRRPETDTLRGGRVLLTEMLSPRIARQGAVYIFSIRGYSSSNNSNL